MNNIDTIYIDDLEIDDLIDDFDEVLDFDTTITGNPFSSSNSVDFNTIYENNHISILNSSNFNVSFQVIYTLATQNIDLNSGEFLPLYTRQIPFSKNAAFIYLIINSINTSKQENVIYHSTLEINKNYKFTVSGDLNNPIILQD